MLHNNNNNDNVMTFLGIAREKGQVSKKPLDQQNRLSLTQENYFYEIS